MPFGAKYDSILALWCPLYWWVWLTILLAGTDTKTYIGRRHQQSIVVRWLWFLPSFSFPLLCCDFGFVWRVRPAENTWQGLTPDIDSWKQTSLQYSSLVASCGFQLHVLCLWVSQKWFWIQDWQQIWFTHQTGTGTSTIKLAREWPRNDENSFIS